MQVEVGAARLHGVLGEHRRQVGARRQGEVADRAAAVAERLVVVVEHRDPVARWLDAALDLEHGGIERHRRLQVGRPGRQVERRRGTPGDGEPERVTVCHLGAGTRLVGAAVACCRFVAHAASGAAGSGVSTSVTGGTTTATSALSVSSTVGTRSACRKPLPRSRSCSTGVPKSIRGVGPGGTGSSSRNDSIAAPALYTRSCPGASSSTTARDRRGEVDDETPVVETRPDPERLARRVEWDAASRDPHEPSVRRAGCEADRDGPRHADARPTERELGREQRAGRDCGEAVVRVAHVGGRVGGAHPVLVGLARHERGVAVEETEAERTPPRRMGEHQPERVEGARLVGVVGWVLADEQCELGRPRRSDRRQHRPHHRGEAGELVGADVLAGQQPAPRLGELVGVAVQRRHQLAERQRQPADDRRDVVPVVGRRAGRVLDEVDAHPQRCRVERVDDHGVESGRPDAVARRPRLGPGGADDAPVVERGDERQLRGHGDLDDAVVGVEVDTEDLRRRVRRLGARIEVVDIVEPPAVAQGHDTEPQPLLAHPAELVDRHGIEPFAVARRRRPRHAALHREPTGRVHPRARPTPRQMNSDEP